jgi:hypothetical protein
MCCFVCVSKAILVDRNQMTILKKTVHGWVILKAEIFRSIITLYFKD